MDANRSPGRDAVSDDRYELGVPGPMRDALVASVLRGEKTVTSSLLGQYEEARETVPQVGRYVLVDSDEQPVAQIEVIRVEVIRLGEVNLRIALGEGEGFRSVGDWRAAHERFWASELLTGEDDPVAPALDDDTRIVIEHFRMVGRVSADAN